MLGLSWALFLSAMMTGIVVTAPLADQVFHKGAVGYGWLNGGWGVGASASAFYAPVLIKKFGARRAMAISLAVLAVLMTAAPLAPVLMIAVAAYAIMGSGRGVTGVAMIESHGTDSPAFHGRVNTFGRSPEHTLQVLQSYWSARWRSGTWWRDFPLLESSALFGFISAMWPVRVARPAEIAPVGQ